MKILYFQPDVYTTFIPCLLNILIGSTFISVLLWYMVKNEHYLLEHPIKKKLTNYYFIINHLKH